MTSILKLNPDIYYKPKKNPHNIIGFHNLIGEMSNTRQHAIYYKQLSTNNDLGTW